MKMSYGENRQVKIGFSIWPNGRHSSSWRLPEANPGREFDPQTYIDTLKLAEKGTFDYYFVGNGLSSQIDNPHAVSGYHKPDTFGITSYLAAISTHIGLVATLNTSYQDPYNTARQAATLDHLSKGRAALNIVLGRDDEAAKNFGLQAHPDNTERYERGEEFMDVLNALQDSWEDDWFVGDKQKGVFADLSKAHRLNHSGKHFGVQGPLNVPRPLQGRVPIVHAGQSERSYEFGAKYADIRFIPFESNQGEYYRQNKARLAKYGRREEDYYLLPGITFYAFESSREAHAKFREVQNLSLVEWAPQRLSRGLGVDLSRVNPKEKVVDVLDLSKLPDPAFFNAHVSSPEWQAFKHSEETAWIVHKAIEAFGDENISFEELFHFFVNGPYHQVPVVGSGVEVADWIEEQWREHRLDGVVVFPPYLHDPLKNFVELVVPELRRRGIFRTEYKTSTFRGHFNLPKAENRFLDKAPDALAAS